MRMLDLFAGRLGWARGFAARGWHCTAIDLVEPPSIPDGINFVKADVLGLSAWWLTSGKYAPFDFICASSPCEEFSVHGMKHFHPNPKYPAMGLKLFNHAREICEASGVPYVMENVCAAEEFVGPAVFRCG